MAEDAVRVFISYSHKDEALRDSLDTHLSNLRWDGVISSWYDRQLTAGMQWDDKIKAELESADIILLLISPDFIASQYCRDVEIPMALQRHESRQACVVPVILRPFDWFSAPFAKLQAFPKDAKPVTTWANQDEAFVSIAQGIRTAAKQMLDYRKQEAEQKQLIRAQYLQKVEEVLSDGMISIVERDTLDELRESLGLTPEEATEIETRAYEPYSRVEENLNKYKQTLNRLIEKGYYPFSEEIQKDLENRQRDLGLKPEDAARISKPILDQAELNYQAQKKQLTEAEKLQALEQQRQQEQKEYEAKLERYRQEFSRAIQAEYPLNDHVIEGLTNFRQQLGLKNEDFTQIEQSILEPTEAKYREQLKRKAEAEKQQIELKRQRQAELERQEKLDSQQQPTSSVAVDKLISDAGVDYTQLRNFLRNGQWKKADQETTLSLLKASLLGDRGYFDEASISTISCEDLHIVDNLWLQHSGDRFGFSVQKKIFEDVKGNKGAFGQAVGWRGETMFDWKLHENLVWTKDAPRGQLPTLKNASRGDSHMDNPNSGAGVDRLPSVITRLSQCGFLNAAVYTGEGDPDDDLRSEQGVDYRELRDYLKKGDWNAANQTTFVILLVNVFHITGKLPPESFSYIPCTDLHTIDKLWMKYSQGRFGFSVQKRIFSDVNQNPDSFSKRVGWRKGVSWLNYPELTLGFNAPEGHLPTNCEFYIEGKETKVRFAWNGQPSAVEGNIRQMMSSLSERLEFCKI